MKLSKFLFTCFFVTYFIFSGLAQVSDLGFNYQSVIRENGQILTNENVSIRFSVLQNGTTIFSEIHQTTTSEHGIANLVIGSESANTFDNIDWANAKPALVVELNTGNGWVDMGEVALQSVPYAKVATDMKLEDLTGINFSNPQEGNVLIFEGGEWTSGSEGQTLELNGTTLSITGGNSINLDQITTGGDGWGTQVAETDLSLSGDGTVASPLKISDQNANSGDVLTYNGSNWVPNPAQTSTGDITSVTAGTGLTGGGNTGAVTLNAQTGTALWNADKIQGINVNLNQPEFGQVLAYDGSNFINSFQLDGDFIPNVQIPGALAALAPVQFPIGGDVTANNVSGYVVSGDVFGLHIAIDNNEIMAKTSEDAAGNLFLQNEGGGRVAIGLGFAVPSHILHVNGVARSNSATWATSSDRRVKENIHPIKKAIETLQKFNPVTFDYIEKYRKDRVGLEKTKYGFIAQEVEAVFPDMISTVEESLDGEIIEDFKVLNTDALVPLLVKALKEQQEMIDALNDRIEKLESTQNP